MLERGGNNNHRENENTSIFEHSAEGVSPELVAFLRIAERENVYQRLTQSRKERIEYFVVDGLTEAQIAGKHRVTKQAISQTLRLTPRSLYRDMTEIAIRQRRPLFLSEVGLAYQALVETLDPKGTGRHRFYRRRTF